jgi:hypothetical protein
MNTIKDDRNVVQPKLDKKESALVSFEIETESADKSANGSVEDPGIAVLDPIDRLETHSLLSTATQIVKDWLATGVIGFFVVSYWRGTWTLFDIWYVRCTPATLQLYRGRLSKKRTALSHTHNYFIFPLSGGAINQNKLR